LKHFVLMSAVNRVNLYGFKKRSVFFENNIMLFTHNFGTIFRIFFWELMYKLRLLYVQ